VSKHWKPNKPTVELAPSRIRRAPERKQTIVRRSDGEELWFGVVGVVIVAAVLAIAIVAIGVVTIVRATTKPDRSFQQCYSAGGRDCVLDGDTLILARERVDIAGMIAPSVNGAACKAERERGIAASVALSNLLRSGNAEVAAPYRNPFGREVRLVKVDGRDVANRMIDAGHARRDEGQSVDWCS
jgi:endonuclease YncB( thermonuclease family)